MVVVRCVNLEESWYLEVKVFAAENGMSLKQALEHLIAVALKLVAEEGE